MKFKLKHLAAAAALVAASPAFAFLAGPDDGGGELVLNVWEKNGYNGGTGDASYALDLGITYAQFIANKNVDLYINQIVSDPYFTQLLSNGSLDLTKLEFSVFVGDRVDTTATFISTFASLPTAKPADNGQLDNGLTQIANYTGALNGQPGMLLNANGSSYATSGAAYYQTGNLLTLANFSSPNSGLVNTAPLAVSEFEAGTPIIKTVFPGVFSFSNATGAYTLQYQVAAVPEPSGIALAMAGFGVMGLIARRRKPR